MGIKTATITAVIAIIAPAISAMTSFTALYGDMALSSILACTASMTTMALSTTIPMASTNANKVTKLIDIPNHWMTKNVPISETGTAMIGIKVERQSPRKINTTMATKIKASRRVCITCSIEASRNWDTS
ncbi:hypothetical protein D3C81_893400 [compost metagenome]